MDVDIELETFIVMYLNKTTNVLYWFVKPTRYSNACNKNTYRISHSPPYRWRISLTDANFGHAVVALR